MGGARIRNLVFLLLAVGFSSLTGACSFVPTAELRVFRESVGAANTAATPVLDELSGTERKAKRDAVTLRERTAVRTGARVDFDPTDAKYFSEIGDGPATAMFRRGHNVLDRLSDVLLSLATGAGAQADAAAIESLASEVASLADLVQPGASEAAGLALAVLHPALKELSAELSRREARRVIAVVQDKKLVKAITGSLIRATPTMFNIMAVDARLRVTSVHATADSAPAYGERVAKLRLVFSNYVVLLQRVEEAWEEAVKATESKSSGNLAALTERVGELRAAAVATRKAYAQMNVGR
jgi:hypothetical protein